MMIESNETNYQFDSLTIQIWAMVFASLGVARGKWLLVENLQHIGFLYIIAAMVVNVMANLMLIPLLGGEGAALATLLAQIVAVILAPAMFKQTRISSRMIVRALLPWMWLRS